MRPSDALYVLLGSCLLLMTACAREVPPEQQATWDDANSAVALVYHHVSAETPRSTSVTPERFVEHLEYLTENDFTIWALPRVLDALRGSEAIPPRTVALTFDDAYLSVYETALPELQARGWPFTIFVSTQYIDDGLGNYMSWEQLRAAEQAGATIANHSRTHPSMAHPGPDESLVDWLARIRAEIETAQQRLEAELDAPARIFAWPYGEYSPPVQALLGELEFTGMAQRSGAMGAGSDFTALPRYPMATGFDDMEQFALKARSRPLPVSAVDPESGVLAPEQDSASVSFSLQPGDYRADAINCYSRGQALEIERLEDTPLRLRVSSAVPLPVGRTTFNCTAPASDGGGWFWHSFLWMRPRADGSWYEG
ncbi:MAG: polysaccharide deacetylase family protein [Gammaproteobacteria bacterium]|nr:polysaccharide deacetylase family protein [Gammaproteobacteria bacterium]